MTTFGLLRANLFSFVLAQFENLEEAERAIGLNPGQVDHGQLTRGISYVCYEFGLYLPPHQTFYAAIGTKLIVDRAVFYAVNQVGETVDLQSLPTVAYYGRGRARVEAAIEAGVVERPCIKVNNLLIWEWPDPRIM